MSTLSCSVNGVGCVSHVSVVTGSSGLCSLQGFLTLLSVAGHTVFTSTSESDLILMAAALYKTAGVVPVQSVHNYAQPPWAYRCNSCSGLMKLLAHGLSLEAASVVIGGLETRFIIP